MRLTTVTLGTSLALGLLMSASAFAQQAIDTKRLHPKAAEFSFEGPFGTYDRGELQRGYQVYKEVCAACHAVNHLAFHHLDEPGGPEFTEAQAKALATAAKIPAEPNDKGETTDDKGQPLTRSATLADHLPAPFPNENAARANNGNNLVRKAIAANGKAATVTNIPVAKVPDRMSPAPTRPFTTA